MLEAVACLAVDGSPSALLQRDGDGDGFGDPEQTVCGELAEGWVPAGGPADCDDSTGLASPGNPPEPLCDTDGVDNDCDGLLDFEEGCD